MIEFPNLIPREEYIVKLTSVDTDYNSTSREEYVLIQDNINPVINQLLVYRFAVTTDSIGIGVSDNSGRVIAIAFIYWKREQYDELDNWEIPLTNGGTNLTFENLNLGLTSIVEILVRDAPYNAIYDNREVVPYNAGIVVNPS